jgi:putative hydrolase of HD superfamily
MDSNELTGCLDFIREAERLKDVLRSSHTSSGRPESTAEHTWRLCLMAMLFEREFGTIDFAKLLKICIVHDLGEAISGDIPAVEQSERPDKSAQERSDLLQLLAPLDARRRTEILALWDEYEHAASPEARLVKGLDKLETIIQHNQGRNPPDFDYAFNLGYGQKHMGAHPLFAQIRQRVDADTSRRAGEEQGT